MQLQAAQRDMCAVPPPFAQKLETAIDLARTHMVEARRSVGALRPNVGDGEEISHGPQAAHRAWRSGRPRCRSRSTWSELPRLGDAVEREIVGIAQEALTNAVRHSRARRITVSASTVRSIGLRLSVADDGRGFAPRSSTRRLRHDQHAGARRTDRRVTDDRHRARGGHRSRARLGSVVAADCRSMLPAEVTTLAPATKATVLLVDDHALLRTGVANIINQEPDLAGRRRGGQRRRRRSPLSSGTIPTSRCSTCGCR